MTTNKLYIWDNVLTDYTDGIMFAVAESVEEARAMLTQESSNIGDDLLKEPKVYGLDQRTCRVVWGGG